MQLPRAQWQTLEAHYATPPRAYHNFVHVADVMRRYDEVAAAVGWRQPEEVWLAVLYHDAVYEAGRDDNEARSAALATAEIGRWLADARVDAGRVAELIGLTARHGAISPADVDADARHFLDCDMAILGDPPDRFDTYERAIAEEHRDRVSEAAFRFGRARFLAALLSRERIYLSEHFHARRDATARANLRRALARIV